MNITGKEPNVEVVQLSTTDPGAGIFLECLVPFYDELLYRPRLQRINKNP